MGLARYLRKEIGIDIYRGSEKDVHFFIFTDHSVIQYDGTEAIIQVLGIKYPFLIKLYSISIFKPVFKGFYWIVKKLRKYFGFVFKNP